MYDLCAFASGGGESQVDVYAFAMIAYELFETRKPFGNLPPLEAAQRACAQHARPPWGKVNGCAPLVTEACALMK